MGQSKETIHCPEICGRKKNQLFPDSRYYVGSAKYCNYADTTVEFRGSHDYALRAMSRHYTNTMVDSHGDTAAQGKPSHPTIPFRVHAHDALTASHHTQQFPSACTPMTQMRSPALLPSPVQPKSSVTLQNSRRSEIYLMPSESSASKSAGF